MKKCLAVEGSIARHSKKGDEAYEMFMEGYNDKQPTLFVGDSKFYKQNFMREQKQ